jgi:VIT1/CCC1 family predicted Fe2+/Mn2+ transporter
MFQDRPLSLAGRYLDPATRMGEILFGLIMTLTFTLGAGIIIQEEGRAGARDLLIATIGCNLAWGLIDGVFYVLGAVFERGRRLRLALSVQQAASNADARKLVAGELDDVLASITEPAEREGFYGDIVRQLKAAATPGRTGMTKDDLLGGIASGWLVFATSFPAALPFFFLDDPHFALRVSNAILLGLLFAVGYRFARHTMARPWLAGTTFLLVGVALVAAAIALGG